MGLGAAALVALELEEDVVFAGATYEVQILEVGEFGT